MCYLNNFDFVVVNYQKLKKLITQTTKFFILFTLLTTHLIANDYYSWVQSIHTTLGVPFDNDTTDDYIIIRPQYVLSYNHTKGVANWVSWQLTKDWFGDAPRYEGDFITDTTLPANMYRVKHSDYTNSGFDRGHLVRSEERTRTIEDNKSTFILTNIIPQTPDLNRGVWLDFEYYCEELCKKFDRDLYIYAGGIFHTNKTLKDEGKVAIPDTCFKIVFVCLKNSIIPIDTIVVKMPNINGVRSDKWTKYKSTIQEVEQSTGYKFTRSLTNIKENSIKETNPASNYIYDLEGRIWNKQTHILPKIYFQFNGFKWEKKLNLDGY